MKDPEITCDWIDRYNDNELDEAEKEIFQKRMLINPLLRSEVNIDACLNRFLKDEHLLDLIDKIGSASKRNTDGNRQMTYLLFAASVICLAMTGSIFYWLGANFAPTLPNSQQHSNHHILEGHGNPADMNYLSQLYHPAFNDLLPYNKETPQSLMTNNFKSLEEFEFLIGSVTRSYQFKLITPDVNFTIISGTDVFFTWRDIDIMEPINIVILNNIGIRVFEVSLTHVNSYILKTDGFGEGLYYWKIMADDNMMLMGKLTIL